MRSQKQEPANINVLRYKCRICKETFTRKLEWGRHMIKFHDGQSGDKALGSNA